MTSDSAEIASAEMEFFETVSVPVFGNIPAGWPEEREQGGALTSQIFQLRDSRNQFPKGSFGLRVQGESMNAAKPRPILDGDTVILLPPELRQPRDGDIVAALVDGRSTLKRLFCPPRKKCVIKAESNDPMFSKAIVPADELTIQGVMIAKL